MAKKDFKESTTLPLSDIEESNKAELKVEEVLTTIGEYLENTSKLLDDLERRGSLGTAIQRVASDLADLVGGVARDLDHGDDSNSQKQWARAILDDAHSQLELERRSLAIDRETNLIESIQAQGHVSAAKAISELTEHDLANAMTAARTILLDVEDSLRNISQDDAEEIADVGVVVAKMFLWALEDIHRQITPSMITGEDFSSSSVSIELLDDEDGISNNRYVDQSKRRQERMRFLWPPIGPALGCLVSWGREEAFKNPILSIALGMTLWPSALMAAFIGGPIPAADWCIQKSYNALEDTPLMEAAEVSAANAFQIGRFYFLVAKLCVKQSIHFGKRQIERRGGVEHVAGDARDWLVDRALHPLESADMLWKSAIWTGGKIIEGIHFVTEAAAGNDQSTNNHFARDEIL